VEGLAEFYKLKAKPQPVKPAEPIKSDTLYRVQVGAFANKNNAEKLAAELKSKGYSAFITN
jgi:N-acetylmuramoyl-L-alanine amidase